jgi:hypothetical protein
VGSCRAQLPNTGEPIPANIVTIVPAWSAFRVVRIGDEILIIDPVTFAIVDVLS